MIEEITKRYRAELKLTQEEFGAALCEQLPGTSLTRQAVNHWETGNNTPGYNFCLMIFCKYSDWRNDWAHECLQVLRPDLWSKQ